MSLSMRRLLAELKAEVVSQVNFLAFARGIMLRILPISSYVTRQF